MAARGFIDILSFIGYASSGISKYTQEPSKPTLANKFVYSPINIKMKKHLSLIIAICISVSSFAAPWDLVSRKQQTKAHIAFTDPYVTYYYGQIVGTFNAPNYALKITVQFDQSVPEPYMATIQVFGVWNSQPGGASYKEFNIYLNTGNWTKTLTVPMSPSEEAYVGVMDLLYYGPQ